MFQGEEHIRHWGTIVMASSGELARRREPALRRLENSRLHPRSHTGALPVNEPGSTWTAAATRAARRTPRPSRAPRRCCAPAALWRSRPRPSTGSAPTRPMPAAVARIYAAKERPRFNPLISHLPDARCRARGGRLRRQRGALAQRFWPGPLTLVVPARPDAASAICARAGLDNVALRVPAHPLAQALLAAAGRPVAAPSANRSGRVSPTRRRPCLADLDGRIDRRARWRRTPRSASNRPWSPVSTARRGCCGPAA